MKPCLHLLVVLLLPVLAGAEEKTGLEQAKRELNTLPATKAGLEQQRVEMPGIAAPVIITESLPSALPAAPSADRKGRGEKEAKKSANWLVDAMMKEADRAEAAGRGGRKLDRPGRDRPEATILGEADEAGQTALNPEPAERGNAREAAQRDPHESPKVDNPLAPFMADWISKRDQPLLLPKPEATAGFDPVRAAGPPGLGPVSEIPNGGNLSAAPLGPMPGQNPAPGLPLESNPFLQGLAEAQAGALAKTAPVPTPAILPPSPVAERGAPMLAPEKPAAAKTPGPPDLTKPADDAKYFPQLKRF